ncbi:MAG: hypothetical protein M1820_006007 [Bogoriella megaspora]|nr:MAG: hypothetical protein M1820_006007 [Bogoriella megaspora]
MAAFTIDQLVQWLPQAVTIFLVYAITRCIYLLYFHPASKFPGPKLAAVTDLVFAYHWFRGKWPWAVEEMLKKYGNVVRVAPNEVVFATPQAAIDIYNPAIKHHETWLKTDIMDFGAGDGGFIWEQDPAKRREVGKKILPAFSAKAIKAKEPIVQEYVDFFVQKMKEISMSSPKGIILNQWLHWFAMDMSADLAYSREMHQMRDENNTEFLEILLGTNFLGTIMQVSKKFPILGRLSFLFTSPRVLLLLPKFFRMNAQAIQARIDNRGKTKHPDFFDFMLPKDTPEPTTKKQKVHLDQVALQLFIAGWDPMQLTLYGCFYFAFKSPNVLATLVTEIRSSFQRYGDINPGDLVGLKYLNACIHETFRCHTTIANGLPRQSPGAIVDGYYVPKGIVCEISYFAICRDSRYFRDPLEFRPERWLPTDHPKYDAKFANDDLKSFFPFGLGPRACTGKEIAWSQIRLFLAKVLWTFDLELLRGADTNFDEHFSAHVMWYKPELIVKFFLR